MRANRSVSGLERTLRRALWRSGARGYRVHSSLPGRPDIVFPRERIAVFVNGCFWHACPACDPPKPKANAQFWSAKLDANVDRDQAVHAQLREQGWDVVIVWEHQLRADSVAVAASLVRHRAAERARRLSGSADA